MAMAQLKQWLETLISESFCRSLKSIICVVWKFCLLVLIFKTYNFSSPFIFSPRSIYKYWALVNVLKANRHLMVFQTFQRFLFTKFFGLLFQKSKLKRMRHAFSFFNYTIFKRRPDYPSLPLNPKQVSPFCLRRIPFYWFINIQSQVQ